MRGSVVSAWGRAALLLVVVGLAATGCAGSRLSVGRPRLVGLSPFDGDDVRQRLGRQIAADGDQIARCYDHLVDRTHVRSKQAAMLALTLRSQTVAVMAALPLTGETIEDADLLDCLNTRASVWRVDGGDADARVRVSVWPHPSPVVVEDARARAALFRPQE